MEASPGTAQALRPLGLGEILDRAVNLTVKYFLLFALIAAAFAIPEAVLQYKSSEASGAFFAAVADAIKQSGQGKSATPVVPYFPSSSGVWTFVPLLWLFFIYPFLIAALMVASASVYFGRTITARAALSAALRRWPQLIGINAMFVVSSLILFVAVLLVGFFIGVGLFAIVSTLHAVGVAIAVAVGVVLILLLVALELIVSLAYWMSYFACVVEGSNCVVAFVRGIERVFSKIGMRRSLLIGLAYIAITIGILIVAALGSSLLVGLLHVTALGAVFAAVLNLVSTAFSVCFMTIFYFDLRVREEGLDLELAARGLETGVAPAP
ncbi:MAG: hypothetical protein GIW95_01815 [Candidatus Eremiobacteraeota bacterium]|nr:hypothetical protein [Candidatus Eremiobacteraeota bacterium]